MPLRAIVNSCDSMTTAGVLTVAMTPCTLIYRFVHTPGSTGNTPEMLGAARPESEGFNAQPCTAPRRPNSSAQRHGADV